MRGIVESQILKLQEEGVLDRRSARRALRMKDKEDAKERKLEAAKAEEEAKRQAQNQ